MFLVVLGTIKISMYYNLLLFIDLSANGSVWINVYSTYRDWCTEIKI